MAMMAAPEKLIRLLNIVAWLSGRGEQGASRAEVAERFDYPIDQLVPDLLAIERVGEEVEVDHLTMTELFWFEITEKWITVVTNDLLLRPIGVSREELELIYAKARELVENTAGRDGGGDGEGSELSPLERAALKLGTVLGPGAGLVRVNVLSGVGETLGLLEGAIRGRRCVEMDYYSYDRDEMTHRVVEPHRCVYAGFWYLTAHCRRAGDLRIFRLDRVREVAVVDESFDPPDDVDEAVDGVPVDGSLPEVVLDLDRSARWVADQYPNVSAEELDDGGLRVTLPVAAEQWLERLLLRLGPAVTVVEAPQGLGEDLRSAAATRILARYG